MFVPDSPRWKPRWLGMRRPTPPAWLRDDDWIPVGERQLYAEAKRGLAAALSGAVPDGGTALLPAYVPAGVVRAARSAGLSVQYYPVDGDLRLDRNAVDRRLAATDPDVFVLIHYFGFADPAADDLLARARGRGALVVEDCARGAFARDSEGRLLGSRGDLALFCLHKTLGAPHGGLLVSRYTGLPSPQTSVAERSALAVTTAVSVARRLGVRPSIERPSVRTSTSDDDDATGPTAAGNAPRSTVGHVRRPGRLTIRALSETDPEAVRAARAERYATLRSDLTSTSGITVLTPPTYEGACPYGVALRARSRPVRDHIYQHLYDAGLPSNVLTWPVAGLSDTYVDEPGGAMLRERTIVIPTHQQVPTPALERIVERVRTAVEDEAEATRRTAAIPTPTATYATGYTTRQKEP